jgi:hypothetical protein
MRGFGRRLERVEGKKPVEIPERICLSEDEVAELDRPVSIVIPLSNAIHGIITEYHFAETSETRDAIFVMCSTLEAMCKEEDIDMMTAMPVADDYREKDIFNSTIYGYYNKIIRHLADPRNYRWRGRDIAKLRNRLNALMT